MAAILSRPQCVKHIHPFVKLLWEVFPEADVFLYMILLYSFGFGLISLICDEMRINYLHISSSISNMNNWSVLVVGTINFH